MKLTRLALAALLLIIAACGGSDTADTTAPTTTTTTTTVDPNADLRAYVVAVMATEIDETEIPVDEAEAACIAGETFDGIGADRFIEVGFDTDSTPPQAIASFEDLWTDAEWETLIDALFGCTDMTAKMRDAFTANGEMDEATAGCIAGGYVPPGHLRTVMLDRDDEGPEVDAALATLTTLVQECSAI